MKHMHQPDDDEDDKPPSIPSRRDVGGGQQQQKEIILTNAADHDGGESPSYFETNDIEQQHSTRSQTTKPPRNSKEESQKHHHVQGEGISNSKLLPQNTQDDEGKDVSVRANKKTTERLTQSQRRRLYESDDDDGDDSSSSSNDTEIGAVAVEGPGHTMRNRRRDTNDNNDDDILVPNAELVDDAQQQQPSTSIIHAHVVKHQYWKYAVVLIFIAIICVTVILSVALPARTDHVSGGNDNEDGSGGGVAINNISASEDDIVYPVITSAPTETPTDSNFTKVTVLLQMDEFPRETSWMLECDDSLLMNRTFGFYKATFQSDSKSFEVLKGSECTFQIFDSGNDGICCEFGLGYYQIFVGEDITEKGNLRVQGGEFNSTDSVRFVASGPWKLVDEFLGQEQNAHFGWATKLSGDGSVLVVGAPGLISLYCGDTNQNGQVAVYNVSSAKEGGGWRQLGDTIQYNTTSNFFGFSLALSNDGRILAVGTPYWDGSCTGLVRVYDYSSDGNWIQIGDDILGPPSRQTGSSLSLSDNGNRLAVGAPDLGWGGTSGYARVFEYSGGRWGLIGGGLYGNEPLDFFSTSLALSGDGNRIAVGAPDTWDGDKGGYVKVFQYIDTPPFWEQLGQDLAYAHGSGDWFGFSVNLNTDGSVVAVGAPGTFSLMNFGFGEMELSSYVRVFEWQGEQNGWIQRGQELRGEADGDNLGISVALSGDGNSLAIGAPLNDRSGIDAGLVHTFSYSNRTNEWAQYGQTLLGEEPSGGLGTAISLSKDGSIIAVGTPRKNSAGAVGVYVQA